MLAFLDSLLGRWAESSLFWVVSNLRPFLKLTGCTDLIDAVNLAGVKRFHAIFGLLSRVIFCEKLLPSDPVSS